MLLLSNPNSPCSHRAQSSWSGSVAVSQRVESLKHRVANQHAIADKHAVTNQHAITNEHAVTDEHAVV